MTSLGTIASGLDMSMLNVALPAVSAYYQAGAMETSWILLSYMLVNSILILVFGRLADIFGKRRLYLFGCLEYAIASLICGFAPTVQFLIIFRAIQGIGAALIITNTVPLLTDAFPKARLGQALGISAFVLSVSQLVGPVLGGYLTVTFGWQTVFWVVAPMALLCCAWGFYNIKLSPKGEEREKIDFLGILLTFFGLGGLVIALSVVGESGFLNWAVLIGFVSFVLCFVLFVRHVQHVEYPMIDLSLFKIRLFTTASVAGLLSGCMRSGILLLVSLHAQYVNHKNPQDAGLIVLPIAIGTSIAASTVGALSRHIHARYLSTFGLLLMCLGLLLTIIYVNGSMPIVCLLTGETLFGLGVGFFQAPNTTLIMQSVPEKKGGVANGIRSMFQNVGRLTSTALSMMLITTFLPANLRNLIFKGQMFDAEGSETLLLTNGFLLAFIIMLIIGIVATVVSWSRGNGKDPE